MPAPLSAAVLAGCLVALPAAAQPQPKEKEKEKAKEPARPTPPANKDEGKFFAEGPWKAAQAATDRLFKEKKTDLLIETFDAPPKADPEKLKGMSAADREKFFRELALDRVKAAKVRGVYVVVTRTPTYLYVEVTADAGVPADLGPKVRSAILGAFKEKKFDEGLTRAVQLVLDAKGLGEKK